MHARVSKRSRQGGAGGTGAAVTAAVAAAVAAAGATIGAVLLMLFGVPWWTLTLAGARWPVLVVIAVTIGFAGGLVALPVLMYLGHDPRAGDGAARAGDTLLGVVWVLFAWALPGNLLHPVLAIAGVADPLRSRLVAAAVVGVSLVLVLWGYAEAMRVPRVRHVSVTLARWALAWTGCGLCC